MNLSKLYTILKYFCLGAEVLQGQAGKEAMPLTMNSNYRHPLPGPQLHTDDSVAS